MSHNIKIERLQNSLSFMYSISENNKRIAKNTIYLYIRMFFVMIVGFYTSRIVLKTLGVSDYGVYNVLGGIIGMLGYLNTLLSGAISRFLTIDLGKGNIEELKQTFSLCNTLCLVAVAIFLLLGETIGLWFVNTQLNIDETRMDAANLVYQCALFSAVLTILQSPYTASVISHEKMSVYAYVNIFDVIMKLLIVYILVVFDYDKLKLYSLLLLSVNIMNTVIYKIYCNRKFEESNILLYFEKKKFMEMFSYSGWNMIIVFANMLNNYGLNILLNIFFGTIVNAARGLALQVNTLINQLYTNFQTASRPQILKYYAQRNIEGMSNLIVNTSKFSAYLLICLIIPVWFNIDGLLAIWLEDVPDYTASFVCLMMLSSLCSAIDLPVGMGIQAVGKMKLPNLTVSMLYLIIFPVGYIIMKLGAGPIISYIVYIAIAPLILFVDLIILRKYTGFSIHNFMRKVVFPIVYISLLSVALPLLLSLYFEAGFFSTLTQVIVGVLYVSSIVFFLGFTPQMRKYVISKICRRKDE